MYRLRSPVIATVLLSAISPGAIAAVSEGTSVHIGNDHEFGFSRSLANLQP